MLRLAFDGKLYAVDYTLCPLCVLNFCDKNGKIHQRLKYSKLELFSWQKIL